jgi:hypothetical protein
MPRKPFEKGNPGGPGRPPGSKNGSTVCKEWADKFGFDFLKRVAEGTELFEEKRIDSKGKETVTKRTAYVSERTSVTTYLIDRGYGKPTAMVEADLKARITLEDIVLGTLAEDKQA